jgi:hypothetical protein
MEKLMQEIDTLVAKDARRYRIRTIMRPDPDKLEKVLSEYRLGAYLVQPHVPAKGGYRYDYSYLMIEWSESCPPGVRGERAATSSWKTSYEGVFPNTSKDRGHPAVLIHRDGWLRLERSGPQLYQYPCGTWANPAVEMLEPEDREVLLSLARLGFLVSVADGHVGLVRQPAGILDITIRSRPLKKRKRRIGISTLSLGDVKAVPVPEDWRKTLLSQVSAALLRQL